MEKTVDLTPHFRELFNLCTDKQLESAINFLMNNPSECMNELLEIAIKRRP